ncbi:hypothetical protein E4T38_00938 [Aureobasidium subglaciale]|nr:hypothetical protein E4T38_00938 [Aureobasidium subglaciale]KAI5230723.1 hypothetical protein E4T40_00939 [Aureobasidium subglaciale]KAI5233957.1 hypothetical protein E4T41_00937 [Aureobasidium subglaciale]KAI5267253.1 hypothetical protein E4T46_00937 [Aureobasidium subglaciale]
MGSQLEYLEYGDSITSFNDHNTTYCADEQLGSGGFGTVFRVYQDNSNQVYAMKHIVELEDVAQVFNLDDEPILCLFMEIADGDLTAVFQNFHLDYTTRVMLAQAVGYQMSTALQYLHSENIVHADIKPENVLCFGNNFQALRFKLSDFGLSQVLDLDSNDSMRLGGTAHYMAPEVCNGHVEGRYATKADIYSLGMVLYNIIANNLWFPFDGYGRIPGEARIIHAMMARNSKGRPWAMTCVNNRWISDGVHLRRFEQIGLSNACSDEYSSEDHSSNKYHDNEDEDEDDSDDDDEYYSSSDNGYDDRDSLAQHMNRFQIY